MLSDEVKNDVKEMLKSMVDKVEIVYYEDPNAQLNGQIKELLNEVIEQRPDMLSISFSDKEDVLKPAFDLRGKNKGTVRFLGVPSGYEFSTLLSSIIMVSTGDHGLSPDSVSFIESLEKDLDMKVFITPTCPYCPNAVHLAHQFAMVSDKVVGSMVEAMEFPEMSQKFNVSSVPHTIINDQDGYVGAQPENAAIEKIKEIL